MKTECPHCGQHYEIDDQYEGQAVECSKCNREFVVERRNTTSDMLKSAPAFGFSVPTEENIKVQCPYCNSDQLVSKTKGFSIGKAAIGAFLIGPVGLLGGAIGSKKIRVACMHCGREWNIGDQERIRKERAVAPIVMSKAEETKMWIFFAGVALFICVFIASCIFLKSEEQNSLETSIRKQAANYIRSKYSYLTLQDGNMVFQPENERKVTKLDDDLYIVELWCDVERENVRERQHFRVRVETDGHTSTKYQILERRIDKDKSTDSQGNVPKVDPERIFAVPPPMVCDVKCEKMISADQYITTICVKANQWDYTFSIFTDQMRPGGTIINNGNSVLGVYAYGNGNNYTISSQHSTRFKMNIISINYPKKCMAFKFECRLIGGSDLSEYHQYDSPLIKVQGTYFDKLGL